MKKRNELKKRVIKLDLEKIEIDELSKTMLNGIHGGYLSQITLYPCGGCTATQPPCGTQDCNPTIQPSCKGPC